MVLYIVCCAVVVLVSMCSMYGIFLDFKPNVGKYSIHGAYAVGKFDRTFSLVMLLMSYEGSQGDETGDDD